MTSRLRSMVFSLGLISLLTLTAYLYSYGLHAGLQFDDAANLAGLKKLNEGGSIWNFVFGGGAGPIGRPVSLLSFALQMHSWPLAPNDFLYVNVALHLINGCMVIWLGWLLVPGSLEQTRIYQALLIGAVWLMMPLLASSNLMIIQRMATLTATVVLAGLVAYVKIRYCFKNHPRKALIGLSLVVMSFTALAALVKENGLLFPIFCLAIEILLISCIPFQIEDRVWKIWKFAFLLAPLLIVVVYLAMQLDYSQATVVRRGFNGLDRLLYQSQTLFQYLQRAFLPKPSDLGPFHDQLAIVNNASFYLKSLTASIAWMALFGLAVKLRSRYPELMFALVWYLGGHLLESTTVAIELYFEHRNYLPIIGPVVGISIFVFRFYSKELQRAYIGITALYMALLAVSLFLQTTLWGDRLLAANIWTMHNPKSVRAVVHLAKVMGEYGESDQVPRVYENYLKNENDPRVKFYRLLALCRSKLNITDEDKVIDYSLIAGKTAFAINMSSVYQELFEVNQETKCSGISGEDIYRLGQELLQVPELRASHIAVHNVYSIMTVQAILANDFELAKMNIYKALNSDFYLDTFEVALKIAEHTGDKAMENDLWERVYRYRPSHPVKRKIWDRWVAKIKRMHPNDDNG